LIRDRLLAIFEEADLILIPVSTQAAWKFGEKNQDPTSMYLSDVFTVLANLAGLPALAFPAGTHSENHMPIGMQFMAAPGMELMI
jgi:aspartyl-tRNA(Asn)/glutamyl-tRNA(Gln) amidotransferase subunit A